MSVIYAMFNNDGLFQQMLISGVHAIPDGAVKLSEDLSTRILQQPNSIWRIDESGAITSTEPESIAPTREQIEALRLRSYADPLSGSDRYFAEAQRMQVMNEPGWEAVRAAGVARFEEIQAKYPWAFVDEPL